MIDFLAGQNSTIMTYGTTNSGKSYTLQGTTTSPGIIPRCLEFVFSNITTKSTASYKPVNHCDVVCLDPLERAQELEIKTKLLTFASMDKHHYINAYTEMQKLLQEESPIRP
ncbi:PREDICTED: kinesin-like protein KIF20A, partial [Dufourea novaeangliae]|uniref:kinesin-like protein KIF20A n=1 Tax=Dufourea novaeangliae TaxID=178035 RepID=UPI000766EB63